MIDDMFIDSCQQAKKTTMLQMSIFYKDVYAGSFQQHTALDVAMNESFRAVGGM